MRLSALHVYPAKSCAGLSPSSWPVDALGFQYDRRWMVTTPGEGAPQREVPALALVTPEIRPLHLVLRAGHDGADAALDPMGGRPVATQRWTPRFRVVAPDHKADAWFSEAVGLEVVLAWFPSS